MALVPPPVVLPRLPAPVVHVVQAVTDDPALRPLNRHAIAATTVLSGPTVRGTRAVLRPSGKAAAPAAAPAAVKQMIWTANRLTDRRYRWGGGHRSFSDSSYDCSGAVSYALHAAGLLAWPEVSGQLARFGAPGPGRWVTVYANGRHTYTVIAGLRLDTSPVADPTGRSGPRWRVYERPSTHFHRRHPAGL
jgi:hypothetical protein